MFGKTRSARCFLTLAITIASWIFPGAAGSGERADLKIEEGIELNKVADFINAITAANLLNNKSRTVAYSLHSFWALRRENAPRGRGERFVLHDQ
jgi:hypothetical protein